MLAIKKRIWPTLQVRKEDFFQVFPLYHTKTVDHRETSCLSYQTKHFAKGLLAMCGTDPTDGILQFPITENEGVI